MKCKYDVLVIGAGVVGNAVARELSRFCLKIGVLEKELDVCMETSGRNTGMLHAGFTYQTGSLRAICSVEGNAEFDQVAKELDVPFKRTGKLVIGFTDDDMQRLLRFKALGETNGVPGLEMIDRKHMDEIDPGAGGNFAMYAPTSGILNPFIYTVALAENAKRNGVDFYFAHTVTAIRRNADLTHEVETNQGSFHTKWIINCAGLYSAMISELLGIPGYTIRGFKGEYFVLDKAAGKFSKIPVYPAPNAAGGFAVHATPTVDGNVLVGPDSLVTEDFEDYSATQTSMEGLIADGAKMFSQMKREYFIRNFAGIRPKLVDPKTNKVLDFVLEARKEAPNTVNLVGIESPGLTCALPLARRVVSLVTQQEALMPKTDFDPRRKGVLCFAEQDEQTQKQLISENSDYGEIVCRCETVTRAEILQAINNPLGVHTVIGIKNRTRATMGRCQGGYCETRITALIQDVLGKHKEEVLFGRQGSYLFTGGVRQMDQKNCVGLKKLILQE